MAHFKLHYFFYFQHTVGDEHNQTTETNANMNQIMLELKRNNEKLTEVISKLSEADQRSYIQLVKTF